MKTKTALFTLVGSLVIGLGALVLTPDYERRHDISRAYETGYAENPVFDRFVKLGSELGIDVSHMRNVHSEGQIDLNYHPIFCEPSHSFDYIIFGDSVANWGIAPEVVEMLSGKRVAVFASQSIFPNAITYNFFQQIQAEYLKPGGASLFLFAPWAFEKSGNEISPIFKDYEKFAKAGFVSALKEKAPCPTVQHPPRPSGHSLFSQDSYHIFHALIQSTVESLRQHAHLRLPKVDLYTMKVEPITNPEWSKKKAAGDGRNALRWNRWSIMLHITTDIAHSRQNREHPRPTEPKYGKNAPALIAFPGRKFFVIPFLPNGEYPYQRSIYHQFLAQDLQLIDLAWEHPLDEAYPMETIHMANEGILAMSYYLGNWLKIHDK